MSNNGYLTEIYYNWESEKLYVFSEFSNKFSTRNKREFLFDVWLFELVISEVRLSENSYSTQICVERKSFTTIFRLRNRKKVT